MHDERSAERIEALEIKVAFQEHLLAELDDVLRALRDEVERLRRDVGSVKEQVDAMQPAPENAPPPHY